VVTDHVVAAKPESIPAAAALTGIPEKSMKMISDMTKSQPAGPDKDEK
jgi:hypothetical protein